MWFRTVLASLKTRPNGRRAVSRLQVELLEDRYLLSFSPAVIYPVGLNPQVMAVADFNGDGRLDLAVANQSSDTVSILLDHAGGTFQAAQNFASGAGLRSLAVGDFNGDGKPDLVTATTNDISVLLGTGNGSFQPPQSLVLPSQFPSGYTGSTALPQASTSVAVGDFNGDGKLDLAVRGETAFRVLTYSGPYGNDYTMAIEGYVNVLLGNGDASFIAKPAYHLDYGGGSSALALGDFNGDRKLDLLVVDNHGGVNVLPGNGDGTLHAPVLSDSGVAFNSVSTADLNGDGKVDLVTRSFDGNGVLVQKGNSDGTFQAPQTLDGIGSTSQLLDSTIQSMVVGDVDGDGKVDITAFTSATRYASYGYYAGYPVGIDPTTTGYAKVLLGYGDGSFALPTTSTVGSHAGFDNYLTAALADFNGDGRPDLVLTDSSANTVSVAQNAADWSAPPVQATSFIVSGFPLTTTAGLAGGITVTASASSGATATGYTGTVHFSCSDTQAGLPADYTFTTADAGVHIFSATLKTAGTQALTATDTTRASLTGNEAGITVNPAPASHLALSAPAGSTAGNASSVTVTALDPYNNTATGYAGTIHFTSTDGVATLPADYIFTTGDAGTHVFSGVILKTAGSQTVTATDKANGAVTGRAGITVSAAAASTMTVVGFPSSNTAGVAGNLTVTFTDSYGNIARGYTGTVHFTSSDGKASLPANYTFTSADAGVHTFTATLKTAGTQSITATDTKTVSLGGTDGGITVKPGAASQFILSAPASVTAGVAFILTVTIQDAYGNVVTGYTGTIHFTSADRTATLPADYTFTAADKGVHTFTGLILRKKGTKKITLTDTHNSSLTDSVIENVL